jgi:dihydrolipoamide dehydrogenase
MRAKYERYGQPAPRVDFSLIRQEVQDAVRERAEQLVSHLRLVHQQYPALFEFQSGMARLHDTHTVEIISNGTARIVHADNIVLATGSRPRILPDIPVDERTIMTSDGISSLTELPGSIAILGAGVIGCEFATIFSNFGATRVHLIEKADRILPFEDEDLSSVIEGNLRNNGVVIHHRAALVSMEPADGGVRYVLDTPEGRQTVDVDRALISVGRVPNSEGLGFAELGLNMSAGGHILDEDTATNVPGIYAVGDLTADIALVNVGELEGRHAVEKMFGKPRRPITYENISTIMFLNPETAGVGMNEQQAMAQGLSYRVAAFDFNCIPRAMAMRRTQGFFKILVTDDDEMRILGMRAVGEHASSAIQAVALLISMGKGIEELAELIHPHPAIIEGVQECVRMLLGKSIFKPSVFGEHLRYRRYAEGRYVVSEAR